MVPDMVPVMVPQPLRRVSAPRLPFPPATLLLAFVLQLVPGCAAPSGAPSSFGAVEGPDPLGPGRYTLSVRGMSCPKCISNVDLQLARIAGVREVAVDMRNGLVRLSIDDRHEVARSALAAAVADAGFTLASIRTEPRP